MQELIMMEMASQQQQQPKKALWATAIDHKGRTYYYNRVTRESRWSLPEEYEKQQEKNKLNNCCTFTPTMGLPRTVPL